MKASYVSNILEDSLEYRAQRQKIIASNIANINTPNYKEKDLVFEDLLKDNQKSNDLQLKTTNPNHISSFNQSKTKEKYKVVTTNNTYEQNDQNSVDLDKQMSDMAKNSIMFNAINSSIKKDASWFKEVLSASGRN